MNLFQGESFVSQSSQIPVSTPNISQSLTEYADGAQSFVSEKVGQFGEFIQGPAETLSAGLKQPGNIPLVGEIATSVAGQVDKFAKLFQTDVSGTVGALKDKLASQNSTGLGADAEQIKNNNGKFVRLVNTEDSNEEVIFMNTPTISESRTANYEEVSIAHHPGQILRYRNTGVRSWTLEIKLASRTPAEAEKNLKALNFIRGWTMPYYGKTTPSDKLGAPPDILNFSAYGDDVIESHPVVLESYSTSFPNDVDYIQTTYNETAMAFPVLMTLSITLKEAWSPVEFSNFDLTSYKAGKLRSAFGSLKSKDKTSETGLPTAGANVSTDEPNIDENATIGS